jgi:ferritin-like metal-binding protein YciE
MTRTADDTINSYITDMLALEDHIDIVLRAQIAAFRDEYPMFTTQLETIRGNVRRHIQALKGLSDDRDAGAGGTMAEAVKRAGSIVAGLGAAAIDLIRNEHLPKALRDDYTALNLAAIGYVMLLTAARALDDPRVADLAEQHLKDHAEAVMTLHRIIPVAVVTFLQQDALPAHADVLPAVGRTLDEVWRNGTRELEEVGGSRR